MQEAELQAGGPGPEHPAQPAFERIKAHVLRQIRAGVWKEGDAIPSEQALASEFGVARMTANRALRELSDERFLVRVRGSGTYVAQQKFQSTLVEIRSIAEEVRGRGHVHRSELQRLERIRSGEGLAGDFRLVAGKPLFHSVVVHYEDASPIQVEDRFVNPALAPDYMHLDFSTTTANEYLMRVAPLSGVRYCIEARMPSPEVAAMLHAAEGDPSLVLHRTTFSQGQVASVATLWHPGNRYQFTGGF